MKLTDEQIQSIKAKLSKITPGKWSWRMNPKQQSLMLISNASMAPIVMDFWRWGFHSATAVFRNFALDILEKADKWGIRRVAHHDYDLDINHPDAQFIADASEGMRDLLDTIDDQRRKNEQLQTWALEAQEILKLYTITLLM